MESKTVQPELLRLLKQTSYSLWLFVNQFEQNIWKRLYKMCFLKSKFLSNTSRTSLWPDSFYILFIIVLTGVIFKGHNQLLHSDGSAKHHESHSTAEHHRHPVDRGRGLGHSQFTLGGVWRPLERHLGLRYSQSRGNSRVEAASVQPSTVQHPRLGIPHRVLGRVT